MAKENESLTEIKTIEVRNGYGNNDIVVEDNGTTKIAKIVVKEYQIGTMVDTINSFEQQLSDMDTCQAYLTDITGVKHDMLYVDTEIGMFFSYILLN